MYTVKDLCIRFAVTEHTILAWIRSGELRAFNVGRSSAGKKPRWRVSQHALDEFETKRTPTSPPAKALRRKGEADIVEFYK